MKLTSKVFAFSLLCLLATFSYAGEGETRDDIYEEITETIGFVPDFFDPIPLQSLRIYWDHFQDAFLSPGTALSPKEKELAGVAAAATVKCEYCTPMHRRLAIFHGATQQEVDDAAQVAAAVGTWSTHLYSIDYGVEKFKADVDKIICFLDRDNYCTQDK